MFKTTLKALIGSTAIVSAIVMFSADADAGKRRVSGFSAAPVKMKTMKTVKAGSRRTTIKQGFTGTSGVPAQGAGPSRAPPPIGMPTGWWVFANRRAAAPRRGATVNRTAPTRMEMRFWTLRLYQNPIRPGTGFDRSPLPFRGGVT